MLNIIISIDKKIKIYIFNLLNIYIINFPEDINIYFHNIPLSKLILYIRILY